MPFISTRLQQCNNLRMPGYFMSVAGYLVLTGAVGKLQMQTPSVTLQQESLDVCLFLPSFSQP